MTAVIFTTPTFDITKMPRDELITKFQNALEGRVKSAYFFGSFARNDLHKNSDIDLLLIVENPTYKNFIERPLQFSDLNNIFPEIDLLVYTPEEFEKKNKSETQGFWPQMQKELLRIIRIDSLKMTPKLGVQL